MGLGSGHGSSHRRGARRRVETSIVPLLGVWVPEKYMADRLTVTDGKVIVGYGGRKRS